MNAVKFAIVLGAIIFLALNLGGYVHSTYKERARKIIACENAGYAWLDGKCLKVETYNP